MSGDESLFPFGRLLSWGDGFADQHSRGGWIMVGPFVFEAHPWFRVGVCAGWLYLGVYLGPLVVTLGYRRTVLQPDIWRCNVTWKAAAPGSSSGRTPGSEPGSAGSTPAPGIETP